MNSPFSLTNLTCCPLSSAAMRGFQYSVIFANLSAMLTLDMESSKVGRYYAFSGCRITPAGRRKLADGGKSCRYSLGLDGSETRPHANKTAASSSLTAEC